MRRSGLEAFEFAEGVAEGALGGVDAGLEAIELGEADLVGSPEDGVFVLAVVIRGTKFPETGFDEAETAEEPFGIDHGIEEQAFGGSGGAVVVVILGAEGLEVGGFFVADDVGLGVDAGFQGILGRSGLALSGAGTGGFLGIEAIGLGLLFGGHESGG